MKVLPWQCLNSIKKPNITPEVTWTRQNPSSQYRPQVNLTKWLVSVYSSCIFELDFSIKQFVCRFWKQFFFPVTLFHRSGDKTLYQSFMEICSQKLETKDKQKGQHYSFRCESPAAWLLNIAKFFPELVWKYED